MSGTSITPSASGAPLFQINHYTADVGTTSAFGANTFRTPLGLTPAQSFAGEAYSSWVTQAFLRTLLLAGYSVVVRRE